jgi:Ser/Thr protein kinase RdoA (MazF antagonist)
MLSFISNSRSLVTLASSAQAREIGRLLGCFHRLLSTLSPDNLHDPLPGFHVTPEYLQQYDQICTKNFRPVNEKEKLCTTLIEQSRHRVDILERNRERLTTTIIHGDPKAANFLFARENDTAISLIDLDTVMPGVLLHDLGDCLRSCCNPAGEEIDNPDQIFFDSELFTALLQGYCSQAADLLNAKDQELLIDAVWLISFELGLRFFTDHLAGNPYFKVRNPQHNLHRALVQFYLAESVRTQRNRLDLLWQQIMMAENSYY